MITFVSLMGEIHSPLYDVGSAIGSEIEGYFNPFRLAGNIDIWSDDVYHLSDDVAVPRPKGKRYPYRNCKHTDCEAFVTESGHPDLLIEVRDGEPSVVREHGRVYLNPTKDLHATYDLGARPSAIDTKVVSRFVLDEEECDFWGLAPLYVSWVRAYSVNPATKKFSGYIYWTAYDSYQGAFSVVRISGTRTPFEEVDSLPPIPDDTPVTRKQVIMAADLARREAQGKPWSPRRYVNNFIGDIDCYYDSFWAYPADNQGRLREVWNEFSKYAKFLREPEMALEDNSIFYKALDGITPDTTNWGEFFEGVLDAPSDIARLSQGVGNLATHTRSRRFTRMAVSELAGLYLFYLYAIKPTTEDLAILREVENTLRNYSRDLRPKISTRQSYQRDGWEGYQCLQVNLNPSVVDEMSNVDEFLDSASEQGLRIGSIAAPLAREQANRMLNDLSAAGIPTDRYHAVRFLTDMIPLSFAANWVVGFNEKLDALHSGVVWRRLPIDTICRSLKANRDISDGLNDLRMHLGVCGSATGRARYYHRWYSNDVPDLPMPTNHPTQRLSRVWDQAAALCFVRLH